MNGSKKLLILYILEVLQEYSDADHQLSQNDIIHLIKERYGMECERKAVARNITELKEYKYDIAYENGYYLREREFEESELRLLIDGVLASRHIPAEQAKALIEKLNSLSSIYFKHKMRHVCNVSQMRYTANRELFYTIDILDDAIDQQRQVRFFYNKYGVDKKLHHVHDFKATVNPCQMVAANGQYYLIGNNDRFDNVIHWRLDLITEIELLDSPAKQMEKIAGLEHGLNLPTHLAEHIYMFSGESVHVKMRVQTGIISDVIDWFGTDIRITPESPEWCTVQLKVSENAMFYWAMQYGTHVEILEPDELRNWIKSSIIEMNQKYCMDGRDNL